MANTFTTGISTRLAIGVSSPAGVYPVITATPTLAPADQSYPFGTAAAQVDLGYAGTLAVNTGGISLTLNGGGMLDPLGGAFSAARLASIHVYNPGTANVTVGGNFITSNFGASALMPITPGGRWVHDDPSLAALVCGSAGNKVMTFTAASGTQSVQVALGGRSV